jgi:hypothetical protein
VRCLCFAPKSEIIRRSQRRGMIVPKPISKIVRSSMTLKERDTRSKLQRLFSNAGVIRGTLTVRERSCGKSSCRCTKGGPKHSSLYLVVGQDGRYRQFCVPRSREAEARQWVEQYQQMQESLEELSEIYWDKLQSREE